MGTLYIEEKNITINSNDSLFELAKKAGITIPSSCKKRGKCKECLVEVTDGLDSISPRTEEEKHLDAKYRLSCQSHVREGENTDVKLSLLQRPMLKIEESGISFSNGLIIDSTIERKDSDVYLKGEIIDCNNEELYGLAIDIGTTTVVMRLIDLETGEIQKSIAFENPQRFAGTNVMARIAYDSDYGKKELKRVLTAYLSNVILTLGVEVNHIYEVIIGGNTTMRDLFFGLDVHGIGQSPYHSISEIDFSEGKIMSTSLSKTAKKMHLPIHPKGHVYGLPIIGGHVGADTAACILAIDMMSLDEVVVIMDIGTNTEIVIGNKDKILAASSPSGPAFEGGGISCGMPALNGAIEKVKIIEGKVMIETVGDEPAIGICGSGLIDTIGELRRNELINELGRFEEDEKQIDLVTDGSVYLSEFDINLLAQTKGANAAALSILFKQYGISFNDVDRFYLAGGFGQHIDIEAGIRIGMLPDIDFDKFERIGNATIEGLSIALLSDSKRQELDAFVKNIEQINLESDPDFFDYFVDGCLFDKIG